MNKIRGFEIVDKYLDKGLKIPKRATRGSAGYDLSAAKNIVIPSIWKMKDNNNPTKINASVLVPTGIKAYMPTDEYLMLVNRSSNPLKNNLALPNGIGIIDSDYYNNPTNEGEIFVQLINYDLKDYEIKKGDRIAQGIFSPFQTTDEKNEKLNIRTGGLGSTDKK